MGRYFTSVRERGASTQRATRSSYQSRVLEGETNESVKTIKYLDTQVELGDAAGSAPVHSNRAHTTIKSHNLLVSHHIQKLGLHHTVVH